MEDWCHLVQKGIGVPKATTAGPQPWRHCAIWSVMTEAGVSKAWPMHHLDIVSLPIIVVPLHHLPDKGLGVSKAGPIDWKLHHWCPHHKTPFHVSWKPQWQYSLQVPPLELPPPVAQPLGPGVSKTWSKWGMDACLLETSFTVIAPPLICIARWFLRTRTWLT